MRKNLLITGLPGVGKTTLIKNISEELKHYHPIGFYTAEIRERGQRLGFELISLDGNKSILSHVEIKSPCRVGKYKVDIQGFDSFLDTIPFLNPEIRLIVVDEIGTMECLSEKFKRLLTEVLDSQKWIVATIALKGKGLFEEVKQRKDVKIFEISERNRNVLQREILKEVTINL